MKRKLCLLALTAGASLVAGLSVSNADTAQRDYWVKSSCDSSDRIATVRFGPNGAKVEKLTETRILQSDMSGPHGIAFSPDRKNFYVSIGHGRPFGTALKYASETDTVVGQSDWGCFRRPRTSLRMETSSML